MRLRCFSDPAVMELIAKYFGEAVHVLELLSGLTGLICRGEFTEAYLIPPQVWEVTAKLMSSGRIPYAAGMYVGRVARNSLIPSHDFLQHTYEALGHPIKAVTVGNEGLKPFLYGKDVLKASTLKCHPPLRKGDIIGIVGQDNYVYGVGKSTINSCEELNNLRRTDPVALNVFDVGWYLRGGTDPRERKFKNLR